MVIARFAGVVKGLNVGISGVEEMSGVRNVKHEFTAQQLTFTPQGYTSLDQANQWPIPKRVQSR